MELVGGLTAWFMWMGELELEDGTSVHSYKHRSTRRYAHLGVDGQAYDYVGLARHVAAADGRMTIDVDALARQRRYDLACEAARRDERDLDPGFRLVRLTGDDGDGFIADLDGVEGYIEAAEERALRKAA